MKQAHRVTGTAIDRENREKDDFYPTPPEGTEALLRVEQFDGPIWEPACGDGAISRVLESAGYSVISSDLVDRGYGESGVDFLMEWKPRAPNIATNPPFKMVAPFMRKALGLSSGKVAMLLRLACLEGNERREIFDNSPLARVWVFSRRLTMKRGGLDDGNGGGWDARLCVVRMGARLHRPADARMDMIVQYIPHADVPAYEAMGWTRSPALDGTNHGHYSTLMIAPEGPSDGQRAPLVSEEAMPGVTEP